jgi:hypothetical protein
MSLICDSSRYGELLRIYLGNNAIILYLMATLQGVVTQKRYQLETDTVREPDGGFMPSSAYVHPRLRSQHLRTPDHHRTQDLCHETPNFPASQTSPGDRQVRIVIRKHDRKRT